MEKTEMKKTGKELVTAVLKREEKIAIRKWHESLHEPIQLALILTESDQNKLFNDYAAAFTQIAPAVEIKKEKKDTADPPSFRIGSNIFFHSLPREKELDPFLEILSQTADHKFIETNHTDDAEKIKIPAELDLFVALQCGFCPTAVRNLSRLALRNELIRLSIIDAALFPEMAKENDVRSVPTVLLDKQFRWSGSFPMEDVIRMMVQRSPEQLSTGSIQNMVEDGAAGKVAEMMVDYGQIFPSFYDLLIHEKWPVRLGAMVVMETIAEENFDLAGTAAAPLMQRFEGADPSVKGDMLYLLGIIGSPEIIQSLKSILSDSEGPDLKDALQEAISAIESRKPITEKDKQ